MNRAKIIRITPQQAHELVTPDDEHESSGRPTYAPPGLYYTKENDMYIGIDNSTGHAWVEEFASRRKCLKWLKRKLDQHSGGTNYFERFDFNGNRLCEKWSGRLLSRRHRLPVLVITPYSPTRFFVLCR